LEKRNLKSSCEITLKKREEQIDRVMLSTFGMYGDLQGIGGKTLQKIESFELRSLDAPKDNGEDTAGKLI